MTVEGGKAERATMPLAHRPVTDERNIAKVQGQQMSPQDAFGVVVVLCIAPASYNQGRLQNITRGIDFAPVRVGIGLGALNSPSQLVMDSPQSIVVECFDTVRQRSVVG